MQHQHLVTTMRAITACLVISFISAGSALADSVRWTFEATSKAPLSNPHDIKLSPDGSRLFVSDVGNNRVVILDPHSLSYMASFGAHEQNGTHDVDFDARGRLYVADTHNHRTAVYELDGNKAKLIGELSEKIRAPEGVLAHPNGRVYVTGAGSGNIVAYLSGRVVAEQDGLSAPHDVEVAPNGNIWVADSGNNRMLLMSPDLKILRELSGAPYNFSGQRYLDVAPNGTLIIADKHTHSVKLITANGALVATMGNGRAGRGPDRFRTPEGVELVGDTLWIADSGNDRIVRYKLTFD
ncbi:MAG: NHL repeat-containing protein [Gammaproteobacteria bacterium]|nr:NHL repeat-containing protein [Gammaproteobacteria bacterium]